MERVALPFSRWSSQPRDQTLVSCTAGRFFTISPRLYTGKESVWQCRKCRKSGFHSWLRKIPWSRKLKESFGPRKENNSLKGPLLNHLTSEKQNRILVPPWCSGPVASIWDLSTPVQKPSTPYTCPEDLSPPISLIVRELCTPYTRPEDLSPSAQAQMSSQQKNTQNIPPD